MKRIFLTKLLIPGQGRELDIKAILKYETTLIPLAVFNENGEMRKTAKSQLTKELEKLMVGDNVFNYSCKSKSLIIE